MTTAAVLAPLSAHSAAVRVGALVLVLFSALQLRSSQAPSARALSASNVLSSSATIAVLWQAAPEFAAAFGPLFFVILVVHTGTLRSRRETFAQLAWALTLFTVLLVARVDERMIVSTAVTTCAVLGLLAAAVTEARLRIERLVAQLRHTADFDAMTGLLNRHGVQQRTTSENSSKSGTTAILVDLDHFKAINDQHGHLAGDDVLIWIGQTLTAAVRAPDLVARYGGEEFLVLVPGSDLDCGRQLAERLRALIEDGSRQLPHPVTVSAGIAIGSASEELSSLYARADHALYRAKAAGRNRVEINLDIVTPPLAAAV